jgi:hypothetical protein
MSLGHLPFENASSDVIRRDSDILGSLMSVHSIPSTIYPNLSIEFFGSSDTQDVDAVETVISLRYPQNSPLPDDKQMRKGFGR